jgi:hypothetical protein
MYMINCLVHIQRSYPFRTYTFQSVDHHQCPYVVYNIYVSKQNWLYLYECAHEQYPLVRYNICIP